MAILSESATVNAVTAGVRRAPTHAEALAEFRDAAAQHPEWEIDMEGVLASVRFVRGESV